MPIGDLDGHLIPDRAAGLDDGRDTTLARQLDGVREREIRVRGQRRQRGPIGCPMEGDLDRGQPAGLAGANTHQRPMPREHDRVAGHMPYRAPREQQVGQLDDNLLDA